MTTETRDTIAGIGVVAASGATLAGAVLASAPLAVVGAAVGGVSLLFGGSGRSSKHKISTDNDPLVFHEVCEADDEVLMK